MVGADLCCAMNMLREQVEARGGRGRSIGSGHGTTRVVVVPVPRAPRTAHDPAATRQDGNERSRPGAFNGVYSRSDGRGAGVWPARSGTPAVSAVPASSPIPAVPPVAPMIAQESPPAAEPDKTARASGGEHAPRYSRAAAAIVRVRAVPEHTYAIRPCRSEGSGDLICSLH